MEFSPSFPSLAFAVLIVDNFPASRGLSRREKNERKERDLCRDPTRFLSRMRQRFLNNE